MQGRDAVQQKVVQESSSRVGLSLSSALFAGLGHPCSSAMLMIPLVLHDVLMCCLQCSRALALHKLWLHKLTACWQMVAQRQPSLSTQAMAAGIETMPMMNDAVCMVTCAACRPSCWLMRSAGPSGEPSVSVSCIHCLRCQPMLLLTLQCVP